MARRCRHPNTIETSVGYCSGLALLCMDCGNLNTFVSWGPAPITPAVALEIHAAELADNPHWSPGCSCDTCLDMSSDVLVLAATIHAHEADRD